MTNKGKSLLTAILFISVIFFISYLWLKNKSEDIEKNSKYAIAVITSKKGSLNNGNQWYYQFSYQNKVYEGYRSTHVGWDVNIGDHLLVQFSFRNPDHSKIFYEYLLKQEYSNQSNYIGDTIPYSILEYRKKNGRFL